ncbi:MAG: hypothetical protein JXR83_22970 [Deltaproteobacteria bacterium]|nr:hypothetical protein [Deltaproteobacteria bacterium]
MPTINTYLRNHAIRSAAQDIVNVGQTDAASIGKLVAAFSSSPAGAQLADLRNGLLPPDQMLRIAQRGLTSDAKSDLLALLNDASFKNTLDATSLNFLKAVAGLEALRAGGVFGGAPVGATGSVDNAAKAAVAKMKEWIKSGVLDRYYEAAIDVGDASLKDEAMRVFKALPEIRPGSTAEDLVKAGLWSSAPKGLEELQKSARYLPGRQVKVETHVHADLNSGRNFMTYDANGPLGITCRATLVGEKGDNFLVQVEGKADPIEVSKDKVYELNHPHSYSPRCDYTHPFAKAKIAEAAIRMADDVAKLDFTKMKTDGPSGAVGAIFGRGRAAEEMVEVQKRCFKKIHDVVNMTYHKPSGPGWVSGDSDNAGRAAIRGYGVCTEQRQVMRDIAYPFAGIVGFDMRSITGGVHRHTNRTWPMDRQLSTMASGAHDWIEVTFRPSMVMTVCDRTWQQCNKSLFEAYGPYGDRYPTDNAYDATQIDPSPTDVNLSGNISVRNYDLQFGDASTSGRQNHQ